MPAAEQRQDDTLLTRIRGQDLFACETKYHRSCLRSYLQNPDHWRSTNVDNIQSQLDLGKAHKQAYSSVGSYIDSEIIFAKNIVKLSTLRDLYVDVLEKTDC